MFWRGMQTYLLSSKQLYVITIHLFSQHSLTPTMHGSRPGYTSVNKTSPCSPEADLMEEESGQDKKIHSIFPVEKNKGR